MPRISAIGNQNILGKTKSRFVDFVYVGTVFKEVISNVTLTLPNGVTINGSDLVFDNTKNTYIGYDLPVNFDGTNWSMEIVFEAAQSMWDTSFIFNSPGLMGIGRSTQEFTMTAITVGTSSGNYSIQPWSSTNYTGNSSAATSSPAGQTYAKWIIAPGAGSTLYYTGPSGTIQTTPLSLGTAGGELDKFFIAGWPWAPTTGKYLGKIRAARLSSPADTTVPTSVPVFTSASATANDRVFIVGTGTPVPAIGSFWEGGYYIGNIQVGSLTYAVIIADQATKSVAAAHTGGVPTDGSTSLVDGRTNTALQTNAANAAANYCRSISLNGYTDWYLPAKDEVDLAWANKASIPSAQITDLQLVTSSQTSTFYWGQNLSSIPRQQYLVNLNQTGWVRPVRRVRIA
jgi:hypothetical protein